MLIVPPWPNLDKSQHFLNVDHFCFQPQQLRAPLMAQTAKDQPIMQGCVWFLSQEELLQKGKTAHANILARRIPWTEEPGGLQSMGSRRVGHDRATNTHTPPHSWSMSMPLFLLHYLHSNNEDYLSKGNCVISTKVLLFIPNSKKSYSIMFFQ